MIMHLISRPGRPVHLAVFAYDRTSLADWYPTGWHVPICGQNRAGTKWTLTGPWHEKWSRHAAAGVCSRCNRMASSLFHAAVGLVVGAPVVRVGTLFDLADAEVIHEAAS